MSYTARRLITNAFYLTGIVARELQELSGTQLTDGMDLLNDLLAVKTANTALIPYYTEYSFNAVPNQEEYFIPLLLEAETITFNMGTVRYPVVLLGRKEYFQTTRNDAVDSLPFNARLERTLGGSNLFLYFLPNDAYPFKIWGKFGLDSVDSPDFDLATAYDRYYITYLRYALGEYISAEYNIEYRAQSQQKLDELESLLRNVSPRDFKVQKSSILQDSRSGFTYGDVNLGKGWRPA